MLALFVVCCLLFVVDCVVLQRFVIVCPSSLVVNWAKEFDKWLGKASQPKRVICNKGGEEGVHRIRSFCAIKPLQSEVLIISYDLFRRQSKNFQNVQKVGLLVVDEGHRLKNTKGSLTLTALESLSCDARLCITATPIQNILSDFYNIANFVCPGVLGDLATFRKGMCHDEISDLG
jgi:SNF2 family DNA or RNA helicase